MIKNGHDDLCAFADRFGIPRELVRTALAGSPSPVRQAGRRAADTAAIPIGSRNNALTSIAGRQRRVGASEPEILQRLREVNAVQIEFALEDFELAGIARSVSRYPPDPAAQLLDTLNDAGNAQRLLDHCAGTALYVPSRKKWLLWRDGRWTWDDEGAMVETAKQCARHLLMEAAKLNDDSPRKRVRQHADKSLNISRLKAAVDAAMTDERVVTPLGELDADPMQLGVENGHVDLRDGTLHQPDPKALITLTCPIRYDGDAKCPTFLRFVNVAMGGDAEMVAFVQRIVGYALTGRTDEQAIFFFHGGGANGKSTLVNVLIKLLGSYAVQAPPSMLMSHRFGRQQTNDLARLYRKRLLLCSEVDEGSFLDEALIKDLTGGDTVAARFLYGEFFEFRPECKVIMCGNHRPVIRNHDEGIWRRIVLIPFNVTIQKEDRDPDLPSKLVAELPGILNWAIEGARAWQAQGLNLPEKVRQAGSAYREDMDVLGDWIREECVVGPEHQGKASSLWQSYSGWALSNPAVQLSRGAFASKLGERFPRKRDNKGIVYQGIGVKQDVSPDRQALVPRAKVDLSAPPAQAQEVTTGASASPRAEPDA